MNILTGRKKSVGLLFFLCAFLIILSPYFSWPVSFVAGQLIAVMTIIAWSFRDALILKKRVSVNRFFLLIVLVALVYPASVGVFRGFGFDFAIVKMLMSVVVMIFIGAITANALPCERDENLFLAAMTKTFVVIMFINSL